MSLKKFFFTYRSYTPIPLALFIIYYSNPFWPLCGIGSLFIFLGESLRVYAVRYAGGATRTVKVGAPSLCTTGPYSRMRNPLYVANMIVYTGIALVAGGEVFWIPVLVTWAFFLIQYALIVSLEEETLTGLFGTSYLEYKKNVPSLFPRITPWVNEDNYSPKSLSKTIKTEKRTLQNLTFVLLIIFLKYWFIGG